MRKSEKRNYLESPHYAQRPDISNKSVQPFIPAFLKPMLAANGRLKTRVSGYY